MLRAAVQIGLFQAVLPTKKDPGVKFKNNKRSALLRDGHPNCLKNMVWLSLPITSLFSTRCRIPLAADLQPATEHESADASFTPRCQGET